MNAIIEHAIQMGKTGSRLSPACDWLAGCVVLDVNWHPGTSRPVDDGLRRITLRSLRDYRHPLVETVKRAGLEVVRAIEDHTSVVYVDELRPSHVYEAVNMMDRKIQQKVINRVVDWVNTQPL